MASIDREQVKADWVKRGFNCDLWIDNPGRRWEDFTHATDELVIVLEGKMEFEVAGKLSHPEVGEELLIPAGVAHSARNVGKTIAYWLYGYNQRGVKSLTSALLRQIQREGLRGVASRSGAT